MSFKKHPTRHGLNSKSISNINSFAVVPIMNMDNPMDPPQIQDIFLPFRTFHRPPEGFQMVTKSFPNEKGEVEWVSGIKVNNKGEDVVYIGIIINGEKSRIMLPASTKPDIMRGDTIEVSVVKRRGEWITADNVVDINKASRPKTSKIKFKGKVKWSKFDRDNDGSCKFLAIVLGDDGVDYKLVIPTDCYEETGYVVGDIVDVDYNGIPSKGGWLKIDEDSIKKGGKDDEFIKQREQEKKDWKKSQKKEQVDMDKKLCEEALNDAELCKDQHNVNRILRIIQDTGGSGMDEGEGGQSGGGYGGGFKGTGMRRPDGALYGLPATRRGNLLKILAKHGYIEQIDGRWKRTTKGDNLWNTSDNKYVYDSNYQSEREKRLPRLKKQRDYSRRY